MPAPASSRHMDDDFNTASGIATLFELVRAINTARDAGVGGPFFDAAQRTLRELAGVLGLTLAGGAAEASATTSPPRPSSTY